MEFPHFPTSLNDDGEFHVPCSESGQIIIFHQPRSVLRLTNLDFPEVRGFPLL